ncbi:MAG: PilZ domain-containing protein [Desulfopila sp.]|jgi:hypothetical protein|nr:PilZ domain-containing protein [Desulfopila sp.]
MSVEERRTARRVPVKLSVTEEYLAATQHVAAVNISEYGMHYYRPLDSEKRVNREVLLTFSLLDRPQPIKALGWVVEERVTGEKIASHVTFMFLPEKDERSIRDFVASCSEHYFVYC